MLLLLAFVFVLLWLLGAKPGYFLRSCRMLLMKRQSVGACSILRRAGLRILVMIRYYLVSAGPSAADFPNRLLLHLLACSIGLRLAAFQNGARIHDNAECIVGQLALRP